MLMAQCVGDLIVGVVLPFITVNISHDDWRYRDAAVMAFGKALQLWVEPEVMTVLSCFL